MPTLRWLTREQDIRAVSGGLLVIAGSVRSVGRRIEAS